MKKKEQQEPKRKIVWWKKLLFMIILFLFVLISAEVGLQVSKVVQYKTQLEDRFFGEAEDCNAITFLCIGDSLTFGLYVGRDEIYPARLPLHFPKYYPDVPIKVYPLGFPGSNTSEGVIRLRRFFRENPHVRPDFALIMYGINNHYTLRKASFWDWVPRKKKEEYYTYLVGKLQLTKVFNIGAQNARALVKKARSTDFFTYYDILGKQGGWIYFSGFDDELLSKWIEHDLFQMAALLREKGVVPVMMTYHYPRHPHLNPLMRKIAEKGEITILDIEKKALFYYNNDLFASGDFYHLNEEGYRFLAGHILKNFQIHFNEKYIVKTLRLKKTSPKCN